MLQKDQGNKPGEVDVVPLGEEGLETQISDTTKRPERARGWGSRSSLGWGQGRINVQSTG